MRMIAVVPSGLRPIKNESPSTPPVRLAVSKVLVPLLRSTANKSLVEIIVGIVSRSGSNWFG